jgi:hypothetical protein
VASANSIASQPSRATCASRPTARPIPALWRGNGRSGTCSKDRLPRSSPGAHSQTFVKRFSTRFGFRKLLTTASKKKTGPASWIWPASRNGHARPASHPSPAHLPGTSPNIRLRSRLKGASRARRAASPTTLRRCAHKAARRFQQLCARQPLNQNAGRCRLTFFIHRLTGTHRHLAPSTRTISAWISLISLVSASGSGPSRPRRPSVFVSVIGGIAAAAPFAGYTGRAITPGEPGEWHLSRR